MAAETHVRSGGVWRKLVNFYVRSGGVWRDCTEVYVRSGGVWRLVFDKIGDFVDGVSAHAESISSSSGIRTASLRFAPDGTTDSVDVGTTTSWSTAPAAGVGNGKYVRASGSAPSLGTWNSNVGAGWLEMSITIAFSLTSTNPNALGTGNLTIDFSSDGSTVAASWTASLSAGREF